MPITFAHIAAVLPARRGPLSALPFSALAVGSMAPDFGYFLPAGIVRQATHSLPGLFWFCLPAGMICWGLWLAFWRAPVYALLGRDAPRADLRAAPSVAVLGVIALIAGSATHIVWDAFTHEPGFAVQAISFLRMRVFEVGGYTVWVFKLAQHGSSVLGTAVLVWWGMRMHRAAGPPTRRASTARAVFIAVVAIAMLWPVFSISTLSTADGFVKALQRETRPFVIRAGQAGVIAFSIYAIWFHARAIVPRPAGSS